MTQLIIDGIVLPETSRDKYSAYPEVLGQQIDMISGRRVVEVRGMVQKITYAYDYMGDALMCRVLAVIRSGLAFEASYLPDNGDALVTSTFLTESYTNPTFAFSKSGVPYWHNLEFTLREVRPHD